MKIVDIYHHDGNDGLLVFGFFEKLFKLLHKIISVEKPRDKIIICHKRKLVVKKLLLCDIGKNYKIAFDVSCLVSLYMRFNFDKTLSVDMFCNDRILIYLITVGEEKRSDFVSFFLGQHIE